MAVATPGAMHAIFAALDPAAVAGLVVASLAVLLAWSWAHERSVPSLHVELTEQERSGHEGGEGTVYKGKGLSDRDGEIICYDPSTLAIIKRKTIMGREEVEEKVKRAQAAQIKWAKSSFAQRRLLLEVLQKYCLTHMEDICRVSAKDSGKPMLDCVFGEVLTTCEKIRWLVKEGEAAIKPERRSPGALTFYKSARVEFHPLGVIAAIVPWNYPYHNILNPVTAALFAGNAIVVKVSEYASWSAEYYERVIHAALRAVGAPIDLVSIVTGFGGTGEALVKSKAVSKVIFVGSTGIGRKVLLSAAENLTPVVLELGGKDPVIVCDDADLKQMVPILLRGTFQSCGQNCTGCERVLVQKGILDAFLGAVLPVVHQLRQGRPLGEDQGDVVDLGAMCMPQQAGKVQALVDDAVAKGAKLLAGGEMPRRGGGQFYPATVLLGVTPEMHIWSEETFGPVMCIETFETDDEVVAMVNENPFGLGSSVFSGSRARAVAIGQQIRAGATSINDFATTYICQSLPFGGIKQSGFDKFGGVEGLRGMCFVKAVCEDAFPLMKTTVPPELQYPVRANSFAVVGGIVHLFYGLGYWGSLRGLAMLAKAFLGPKPGGKAKQT